MSILSTEIDLRVITASLVKAWEWWKGELAVVIPSSLRERVFGATEILTLDLLEDSFSLSLFMGRDCKTLHREHYSISGDVADTLPETVVNRVARYRRFGIPLVLRLDKENVLDRNLSLPYANQHELRHLLTYEIERQSPLPVSDILFDHRTLERSHDGTRINVTLRIVRRDTISRSLDICRRLTGEPSAIAPVSVEAPQIDDFFDFSRRTEARTLARKSIVPALVLCGLLLAALNLYLLHSNRDARIAAMQTRLTEIQPNVERALALKKEANQAVQQLAFASKRNSEELVVDVISDLASTLPDDSWVHEFEYRNGDVRLRGRSPDASGLLRLFEESGSFSKVAFRAPVIAGRDGEPDRFDLSLSRQKGDGQ